MTRVRVQTFETTGNTSEVFVRDTVSTDGGAWAPISSAGGASSGRATPRWAVNGFFFVDTDFDGAYIADKAGTITTAVLWRRIAGSSGTTEVDIKKNGVTIFSTKPSVTSGAGNNAQSTNAVISSSALVVGDRLTMDITQAEGGSPEDLTLTLGVP